MNITLIGMAGVGKSFIGRRLAERLGYKYIDTDREIEKRYDSGIQGLIDRYGDEKVIEMEEETILDLDMGDCVISTGGSVVYSDRTMEFLKDNSLVVFLDDDFENIRKRVTDIDTRGLIMLKGRTLKELFDERIGLYPKHAEITVKLTGGSDADMIVNEIISSLETR